MNVSDLAGSRLGRLGSAVKVSGCAAVCLALFNIGMSAAQTELNPSCFLSSLANSVESSGRWRTYISTDKKLWFQSRVDQTVLALDKFQCYLTVSSTGVIGGANCFSSDAKYVRRLVSGRFDSTNIDLCSFSGKFTMGEVRPSNVLVEGSIEFKVNHMTMSSDWISTHGMGTAAILPVPDDFTIDMMWDQLPQ